MRPGKETKGKVYIGFIKPPHWTACKDTFLNDLVERAGWKNICKGKGWKPLSGEEILRGSPDLAIVPALNVSKVFPFLRKFPWRNIKVKLVVFSPDLLLRPTLRLSEVYKKIGNLK